jgi:hypothetical protein
VEAGVGEVSKLRRFVGVDSCRKEMALIGIIGYKFQLARVRSKAVRYAELTLWILS